MRCAVPLFFLLFGFFANASAGEKPRENPAAVKFRQRLEKADRDKDGAVTREELAAEISKDPSRDPKTIEQIVSAMIRDLDADHDGKLSAAEAIEGARKAGENATKKENVRRAQAVMEGIAEYRRKHGIGPANLDELARLHLVSDTALRCVLADGNEKPWGYAASNERATGPNDVILFSPGRVDAEGTYIVGLGDGRVLGLHDTELELEKVPRLKMRVYPDK
jgi:EF hand